MYAFRLLNSFFNSITYRYHHHHKHKHLYPIYSFFAEPHGAYQIDSESLLLTNYSNGWGEVHEVMMTKITYKFLFWRVRLICRIRFTTVYFIHCTCRFVASVAYIALEVPFVFIFFSLINLLPLKQQLSSTKRWTHVVTQKIFFILQWLTIFMVNILLFDMQHGMFYIKNVQWQWIHFFLPPGNL